MINLNNITKKSMSLAVCALVGTSAHAALIIPTGVVASSFSGAGNEAINTINGSGLNAPFDETATHDTLNYWQGGVPGIGTTITFDLGGSYDLTGAYIWNYNNSDSSERGFTDFEIYVGGSGDSTASTLVTASAQISQNSIGAPNTAEFESFVASNVRYVRFLSLATGANDRVGLGEVRFDGTLVPEPSTFALLSLGGLALVLRRRRA